MEPQLIQDFHRQHPDQPSQRNTRRTPSPGSSGRGTTREAKEESEVVENEVEPEPGDVESSGSQEY